MSDGKLKDERSSSPRGNEDMTQDANAEECNFHRIRKKFEEKSKTIPPTPPPALKVTSDFQKLYPLFKRYYTKRQFSALENCFNLADRNNDGVLEAKELKQLLTEYQQPTNLCDADLIVSIGDKNQDGKLCPKEFLDLCTPTAEKLREEQFKEGGSFLGDQQFITAILKEVRNLANPVHRNVQGTRLYFESITSGNAQENVDDTPMRKSVVARYLKTIHNV